MRIREPKTTALIFASGKMVVTGAKSEDDSKLASRKYARIIQKLGFNAKFTDFKIQNIVGSCDIKFPIRLEGLASRHHMFSSYEPELFPGLIYRMMKPKIVSVVFLDHTLWSTLIDFTGSLDLRLWENRSHWRKGPRRDISSIRTYFPRFVRLSQVLIDITVPLAISTQYPFTNLLISHLICTAWRGVFYTAALQSVLNQRLLNITTDIICGSGSSKGTIHMEMLAEAESII